MIHEDVPAQIDAYELGERIGVGGFGQVFRARHQTLGRVVAVKVLHAHRCHDPDAVARFVAEAKSVNQIHHAGIVEVEGFGALPDGRQYLVMELIEGTSLRAILDDRVMLPLAEATPLLRRIAEAVDAAHAAGIAHRDLKPENVLVRPDGSVKLIDFGLAKLSADSQITHTGVVLGSPRYMSPEQCTGRGGTMQSDLYSFGALAFHILTGKPPFAGDALALALQHVNDPPPAPGITTAADETILALLAKDPARRPRPLVEAVAAMEGKALRRRRRGRARWLIAGLVVAGAGAGMAMAVTRRRSAPSVVPPVATESAKSLPPLRAKLTKLALDTVASQDPAYVVPPWVSPDGHQFTYVSRSGTYLVTDGVPVLVDKRMTYRSRLRAAGG